MRSMFYSKKIWATAVVILLVAAGAAAYGARSVGPNQTVGTVVATMPNTLVMAEKEGASPQTVQVSTDSHVLLNGMPAKLDQLKRGDFVRVEFKPETKQVATIDAKSGSMRGRTTEEVR